MKSLTDRINATSFIWNLHLPNPHDENSHRPDLSVFASKDKEDDGPRVTIMVDAMFGQQSRFIELTTQEAREFAHIVLEMARAVEAEIAYGLAEPDKLPDQLKAKIDEVLAEVQKPAAHTDAFANGHDDFDH